MTPGSILLVEDSEDDIELTRRAFRRNNLKNTLVVARDGAEALAHLFEGDGDLPEIVLLDLKLPKIDGHEVLRRIRANDRTRLLPVVVLTSSNEQRDMVESYSEGANSYVRKPVDFDQFADAVRQLGLYWLVLNESVVRER